MPPIFGIVNIQLLPIAPDTIYQMKNAAVYTKPRRMEEQKIKGGFLASSLFNENLPKEDKKSTATEGVWIVVADACLYKRNELARKLGMMKETMPGGYSDPQLILKSWKKWGTGCIDHLYGDFAFVVFNTQTGEIFIGRDHLGVRPLFYSLMNNMFIFASELRIILAAMPVKPPVRTDYLLDSLVTRKTEKGKSPFENINRLPPAHFLHISEHRTTLKEYWHLNPENRIRYNSEVEYINLLRDRLLMAVEMRCEGTSIGAELSGGLDSSAISGIASKFLRTNGKVLSTYSNVFPEGTAMEFKDEKNYIGEMVGFTPIQWKGIDHLNRSIPELLQYAIGVQGCYIQQNFSMLSDALYETAGKDNTIVLLSGFGGDEMASTRTGVQWNELIREQEWQVVHNELFHRGITIKTLVKAGIILFRYLYSILRKPGKTSGVFNKKLLDGRFKNIPLRQDFSIEHKLRQRQADQYKRDKRTSLSMKHFDRIRHDHVPQRMEYCYTAAVQYGIEYRYPLLDVDLLETFMAFPPWMKQHQGINRYAFRQAILGYVPETIRLRNDKSGTTIPQSFYSFVNEREEILEIISKASGSALLSEIFDFKKFAHWYDKLVHRADKDKNYLMPGAFYTYLMVLLYYKDTWK